jgi:hypothetical protein
MPIFETGQSRCATALYTSFNNLWVYVAAEEIFVQSRNKREEKERGNPLLPGGFARFKTRSSRELNLYKKDARMDVLVQPTLYF